MLRNFLGEEAFGRLAEDYIEFYILTAVKCAVVWRARARLHARDTGLANEPKRYRSGAVRACALQCLRCGGRANRRHGVLQDTCSEDWPHLTFDFHPSVTLLDFGGGTAELYAALAEENEPPAFKEGEETILFWRNDGHSLYRPAAEDERLALREAMQRKKFAEIIALLAFQSGGDVTQRAAGFVSQWFADGLISRWSIEAGT